MKFIDFNGKEHKIKPNKNIRPENLCSKGHLECRKILKELYPSDNIYEETTIWPGLIVDFLLPLRKLGVEINGNQHYSLNSLFHKDYTDLNNQKSRDNKKEELFQLNRWTLVVLDARKNFDGWKEKILGAFNE